MRDGGEFYLDARFRFETLPDEAYGHRLNVIWFEDTRCSKYGQFGFYLEPKVAEGWQFLSRAGIRPTLDARSVKLELRQSQRSSVRQESGPRRAWGGFAGLFGAEPTSRLASGYWDDIHWIATSKAAAESAPPPCPEVNPEHTRPVGTNYAQNPGFDRDAANWKVSARGRWTGEEGQVSPGALVTTIETKSAGLGVGVFDQCVSLGNRREFEMGVSFKRDPASTQEGGGRFRVTWYQNQDCSGRYKTDTRHADPAPVEGWQELAVTGLRSPDDSLSAKLTMIQSIAGPGVFSVFWDDAYFRATAE